MTKVEITAGTRLAASADMKRSMWFTTRKRESKIVAATSMPEVPNKVSDHERLVGTIAHREKRKPKVGFQPMKIQGFAGRVPSVELWLSENLVCLYAATLSAAKTSNVDPHRPLPNHRFDPHINRPILSWSRSSLSVSHLPMAEIEESIRTQCGRSCQSFWRRRQCGTAQTD